MNGLIVNYFLDYEFVYILLFCSIIFLITSMFVQKKIIKKIFIILFSSFFVLFFFEFALSFFMSRPNVESTYKIYMNRLNGCLGNINTTRRIGFLSSNNEIYDMVWNENINVDKYKDCILLWDKTFSHYDKNLLRVTKCNVDSNSTFIFLGCSFVYGSHLNDDETLPYFFSKQFNFEKNIINCGAQGLSSNTAINILNNDIFLPLINNNESKIKHFFYCLIYDHIYRNFRYESFSMDGFLYRNNKWYIPTLIGKIKYIFARSYIFRKIFVPLIDECFKQYYENYIINSLKEMNKIVEEKYDSKLTIVVWNVFENKFITKLKKNNIDLILLPKYFNLEKYKIKYDWHPTAKANEEIAKILYNHINVLE